MSVLTYKGYQGSVEYEDGTLFIQLLHIEDTVFTECSDASGAKETFEALVEDYLETCRVAGKEPEKPFSGTFNVRIGPELHKAAAHCAARRGLKLNAWVFEAISGHLDRDKLQRDAEREWIKLEPQAHSVRPTFEFWSSASHVSPAGIRVVGSARVRPWQKLLD